MVKGEAGHYHVQLANADTPTPLIGYPSRLSPKVLK